MTDKLIINRTLDINFPFQLRLETEKLNNVREFDFCIGNFEWLTPTKRFIIRVTSPIAKEIIIEGDFIKPYVVLIKLYEWNITSQLSIVTLCNFVDNSDFSSVIASRV